MKQSDIAALIIIASLSVLAAYFVADAVIGGPNSNSLTVKTATPITADLTEPDSSIFNDEAINPTVEVVIGDNLQP